MHDIWTLQTLQQLAAMSRSSPTRVLALIGAFPSTARCMPGPTLPLPAIRRFAIVHAAVYVIASYNLTLQN